MGNGQHLPIPAMNETKSVASGKTVSQHELIQIQFDDSNH
jgi:hypothetical protein